MTHSVLNERSKFQTFCDTVQCTVGMLVIVIGIYRHDWFAVVGGAFLYADIRIDDLCRSLEKRRET